MAAKRFHSDLYEELVIRNPKAVNTVRILKSSEGALRLLRNWESWTKSNQNKKDTGPLHPRPIYAPSGDQGPDANDFPPQQRDAWPVGESDVSPMQLELSRSRLAATVGKLLSDSRYIIWPVFDDVWVFMCLSKAYEAYRFIASIEHFQLVVIDRAPNSAPGEPFQASLGILPHIYVFCSLQRGLRDTKQHDIHIILRVLSVISSDKQFCGLEELDLEWSHNPIITIKARCLILIHIRQGSNQGLKTAPYSEKCSILRSLRDVLRSSAV